MSKEMTKRKKVFSQMQRIRIVELKRNKFKIRISFDCSGYKSRQLNQKIHYTVRVGAGRRVGVVEGGVGHCSSYNLASTVTCCSLHNTRTFEAALWGFGVFLYLDGAALCNWQLS